MPNPDKVVGLGIDSPSVGRPRDRCLLELIRQGTKGHEFNAVVLASRRWRVIVPFRPGVRTARWRAE